MIKNLTILHNNDLHNSLFFKADKDLILHGGISMLSEYVRIVRAEQQNTLYTISGDILQEDISGSDYKGVSTVDIINAIAPDAISLGNHELDYGLAHLLIFKECIKVPVLNANIIVSQFEQNLFIPSMILKAGEVRVLAIGVIPQVFFSQILSDPFCRSMLEYRDSYEAIRTEISRHAPADYDMVILLSHYGLKGDKLLAENMPQDLHVDLILGGHDHINMEEAVEVNGIPIAQSSFGTTCVGRFDIQLDTAKKRIVSYTWKRVEITSELCGFNALLDSLTDNSILNRKKIEKRTVCTFAKVYHHESRLYETELGDLVADSFYHTHHPDFVMLQSGSLRRSECPLEMLESDLKELFPFDDSFCIVRLSGAQLRAGMEYMFTVRPDGSVINGTFQYSEGLRLVVNAEGYLEKGCMTIEEFSLNGQPVQGDRQYRVGVTRNCLSKFMRYFNLVVEPEYVKTVSFSTFENLAEYLLSFDEPVTAPVPGQRFVLKNWDGDIEV